MLNTSGLALDKTESNKACISRWTVQLIPFIAFLMIPAAKQSIFLCGFFFASRKWRYGKTNTKTWLGIGSHTQNDACNYLKQQPAFLKSKASSRNQHGEIENGLNGDENDRGVTFHPYIGKKVPNKLVVAISGSRTNNLLVCLIEKHVNGIDHLKASGDTYGENKWQTHI